MDPTDPNPPTKPGTLAVGWFLWCSQQCHQPLGPRGPLIWVIRNAWENSLGFGSFRDCAKAKNDLQDILEPFHGQCKRMVRLEMLVNSPLGSWFPSWWFGFLEIKVINPVWMIFRLGSLTARILFIPDGCWGFLLSSTIFWLIFLCLKETCWSLRCLLYSQQDILDKRSNKFAVLHIWSRVQNPCLVVLGEELQPISDILWNAPGASTEAFWFPNISPRISCWGEILRGRSRGSTSTSRHVFFSSNDKCWNGLGNREIQ